MFDTVGLAGKLAQVHALLADVAGSITPDTSGPAAAEALREWLAAREQGELVGCLLTERVDRSGAFAADGAVSMQSWLRSTARCKPGTASGWVHTGRALVDLLPATRAAWTRGELTFEHVGVIRRAVDGLDPAQTAYLDKALAHAAADASPPLLTDIAAALLEELAPDRTEKDRDDRQAAQSVHLSDVPDGGRLDGDLDHESTAVLRAAIEKFMPKPEPAERADGTQGRPLPLSHRRALALVEMARQALDFGTGHPGGANKPHLVVSLSLDQLRDRVGVGYLPDGGTLPAADLRRLACDAKIIPVVLGSDGLPLDVGRTTRTTPSWIRIALNERDKGCRYPDCDRPPSECDAHHVIHWVDGGETSLDGLILLCRGHHRRHHKGEFTITTHGNQHFTITKTPTHRRT